MDLAYEQADVFLLSSRLDPLPDVAISAMAHGLPIACFDRTTGIADVLKAQGFEDECVAPYLDVEALADRLCKFVESPEHGRIVGARLKEMAQDLFNMDSYVRQLEDLALRAEEGTRQEKDDCLQIAGAGRLRLDFLVPDGPNRDLVLQDATRRYVRAWASGIRRRKPCPGFHPGIYQEQGEHPASGGDPFAGYLRAGQPSGPWRSEVITPSDSRARLNGNSRIALHLHLYYPDLTPDILERLEGNEVRPDLFISVPSKAAFQQVRVLADAYRGLVRDVQITPNRGRDIGSFLTAFGKRLVDDYSLIGHVHTKKTLDLEASIGRTWFHFLLENLIGGKHRMADHILSRMAEDPTIGLVFPDDPHVLGWSGNQEPARILADRLGLTKLPQLHLNFPVGTMFWARAEAIKPLVELNLEWDDYPSEPLPYDGSMLHAIERLLPFVTERTGLRCAVTNVANVTR
jgi:rhamnan synthesis protein F/glycosyl transferase family 1